MDKAVSACFHLHVICFLWNGSLIHELLLWNNLEVLWTFRLLLSNHCFYKKTNIQRPLPGYFILLKTECAYVLALLYSVHHQPGKEDALHHIEVLHKNVSVRLWGEVAHCVTDAELNGSLQGRWRGLDGKQSEKSSMFTWMWSTKIRTEL